MTVFGQRIHWTESGNGAPVILLHGLGSDSAVWARVTGELAAHRRVITLDQIGFGQSGKPALKYRLDTFTSFLEGFYEVLRLERTSLVAHGVSGAIAIAFAAAHPRLLERLVLVCPGFLLDSNGIELLNPASRADARELAKRTRLHAGDLEADQAWADSMTSAAANQAVIDSVSSGRDSVATLLPTVQHSTLIVWGREDLLTPVERGERIHAAIPDSQMVVIEKAGHTPHRDRPKEFASVVEKFLSGNKVHQRFRKSRQEENVWF